MVTRADIVSEARTWIGTPFRHQGRVKGHGVDCSGLVISVARTLGLTDYQATGYPKHPDGNEMRRVCSEMMDEISIDDAQPGDVILFKFISDPQHLAIVGDHPSGGLSIIHAFAVSRKVVEAILDDVWRSRVIAVYRVRGVA